MAQDRGQWASRLGFVLAASGSAIGLGNLWKFPYITWSNNGGAFVLVYLACVAAIGLPIMISEILIGRKTQKSPVGAMAEAVGSRWAFVGGLGVLSGFVILGYYTVIAGWALRYFAVCMRWSLQGFEEAAASGEAFSIFVGTGWLQALLSTLFMSATIAVVVKGIGGGIEKVSRYLMPSLFGILVLLLISALSMDGAGQALKFIFEPDFSKLEPRGWLEALGHAFFTLSLGMGAMITYGSYLSKKQSIVTSAMLVVVLDTVIAITATIIMFAVIFSVPGMQEQVGGSTVGMLFITLPRIFYTAMPFGTVLAPLFYVLVSFAALTSTISLLEVVASYFIDQRGWSRSKAALTCGLSTLVISILCALSFGSSKALSSFSLVYSGTNHAKHGLFEHLDHLASNWLLPIGGLLITIAIGWFMTRESTESEMPDSETPFWFRYGVWRFFIRYLAPVAVTAIVIAVMTGKDFS